MEYQGVVKGNIVVLEKGEPFPGGIRVEVTPMMLTRLDSVLEVTQEVAKKYGDSKLGVNFRDYLYDRISKQNRMPFLSSLIPNGP